MHDLENSTRLFGLDCFSGSSSFTTSPAKKRVSNENSTDRAALRKYVVCFLSLLATSTASLWMGIYSDEPHGIAKQNKATKMRFLPQP